jgi:hypothetical protein
MARMTRHKTRVFDTRILLQLQQQVPWEDVNRSFNPLPLELPEAISADIEQNAHLVI